MVKIKPSRKIPIPKPKPKGKNPKAKKIKKAAGKKFDIFETLFESDAGSESSRQSASYYEEIQKLSKPQLTKLEKKVQNIRRSLIKSRKKTKEPEKRCSQIIGWIDDRMKYSQIHEELLMKMIRKKVKRYEIAPTSSPDHFTVKKEKYSFRRLSRHYFKEELEQIEKDLESGVLLSPHRGHGAPGILKHLINRVIP